MFFIKLRYQLSSQVVGVLNKGEHAVGAAFSQRTSQLLAFEYYAFMKLVSIKTLTSQVEKGVKRKGKKTCETIVCQLCKPPSACLNMS